MLEGRVHILVLASETRIVLISPRDLTVLCRGEPGQLHLLGGETPALVYGRVACYAERLHGGRLIF